MSNFTFTETELKGLYLIDVKVFGDNRGYFVETYKQAVFAEAGLNVAFVQDNQSGSSRNVLRGLHFQRQFPQAKLVRVIHGTVYDVAVDIRPGSPTFGKWVATILSEENRRQMFIPRGFAHGFLVLSDFAEFAYKCDDVYHPGDEGGIIWNDPSLNIPWPLEGQSPVLSEKDKVHPTMDQF
jgi:dTDP-4-dehydrorhamnose 3,5-epimerase